MVTHDMWNELFTVCGKEPCGVIDVPQIPVIPTEVDRLTHVGTMNLEEYTALLDTVLGEGQSFYL